MFFTKGYSREMSRAKPICKHIHLNLMACGLVVVQMTTTLVLM